MNTTPCNASPHRLMAAMAMGVTALLVPLSVAQAQHTGPSSSSRAVAPSPNQLKRENIRKMMREIPEVSFDDHRLEDIIAFIAEITGAEIEPVWIDDRSVTGLDPDTLITLHVKHVSALRLLEMVLDRAAGADTNAFGSGNTWQMTDWGTIQCGPKENLAKHMRLEVYPIGDMLWEVPDYPDAPTIDLQSVLQNSQGGGGGSSPFDQINDQNITPRPQEERAQDIIDILTQLVEPEQWLEGGGSSTIRFFQGNLLVKAPDFVHRQLGGYPWWPSSQTTVATVNGRRYVGLGVNTGISTVDSFDKQPVTGVVGGGGNNGGPPKPGG